MTASPAPRIRRSLTDIEADYKAGRKAELETLMRAWKGIKELPPEDPNSFFTIGGFHGEPFRGPGATDPVWWGGYCQHGTVLFPTWHRAYLWRIETALRSIPGCGDVTLPFWDECSEQSRTNGIPDALTAETFRLDGKEIPNPLRSFVLPVAIVDQVKGDAALYSKPQHYETVRYPLSGLVGTPQDQTATLAHNAGYPDPAKNAGTLNGNITAWLNTQLTIDGATFGEIHGKFRACLEAPNYTLFSNTTSAGAWSKANKTTIVPLESPHNYMHLAVGGFDVPGQGDLSVIPGANGDMGENDTAGLDPIFFFHHCFIDYVFWTWQRRHGATAQLTIEAGDPGTKYAPPTNQPPAGADKDAPITLDTPLEPFRRPQGTDFLTSRDCIDITRQLGYAYGPGSLDALAQPPVATALAAAPTPPHRVRVSGINRADIRGSFLISAFVRVDGKRQYLGTEPVLSRWHVEGCMNCQNHLEAQAHFALPAALTAGAMPQVEVEVRTRRGMLGGGPHALASATAGPGGGAAPPFKAEIV